MKNTVVLLGVTALLLIGVSGHAKKMYKYQDAQGRWQFADRPPKDLSNVETQQLRISAPARKASLVRRGGDDAPQYVVINQYHGPVELQLSLENAVNIAPYPPLPLSLVVPPVSEMRAALIRPQDPARGWRYSIRARIMLGDPNAEHRPPVPYRPPFAPGATYSVTQAFHGGFSHNQPSSRYAVDFAMPENSAVHAARGGVVMDLANDFFGGGGDAARYLDRANMIRILHDDGTMAVYGHLRLESAQVVSGARVAAGQLIGRSGNTGYSTGPHLHFVIQKNAGATLAALPFEFADAAGRPRQPQRGMTLTGY